MSSFSLKAVWITTALAVLTITTMPNPALAAQRSPSCGVLSDSVCCERCMAGRISNSHDSRSQAATNCSLGGMCNISHAPPAGPAVRQVPPGYNCNSCMQQWLSGGNSRASVVEHCIRIGWCAAANNAPPAPAKQPAAPAPSHVVQSPAPRQPAAPAPLAGVPQAAMAPTMCGTIHNDTIRQQGNSTLTLTVSPGPGFNGTMTIGSGLEGGTERFTGQRNAGNCEALSSTDHIHLTGSCGPAGFTGIYTVPSLIHPGTTETGTFHLAACRL